MSVQEVKAKILSVAKVWESYFCVIFEVGDHTYLKPKQNYEGLGWKLNGVDLFGSENSNLTEDIKTIKRTGGYGLMFVVVVSGFVFLFVFVCGFRKLKLFWMYHFTPFKSLPTPCKDF